MEGCLAAARMRRTRSDVVEREMRTARIERTLKYEPNVIARL